MDQNSFLPVPGSNTPQDNDGALDSSAPAAAPAIPSMAPPLDPAAPAQVPPAVAPADPFAVTPKLAQQISSIPPEANDVDVIEKEWVNHLKEIAARTATNPFIQQQEISRAKADYLKKRYNKDIKVSEGN